jgi:ribose/xylose/arabinose/galactoside ABC-type transport system permease subunit
VQIGSPIIGNQALESIAAAVLGGASLAGGKGSFFGTLLAAFFLTEIDNVLPLFQQPTEYADMTIGVLILLALVLYQAPELLDRLRTSWGGVGRMQAGQDDAHAGGEAPAG